ncbi:MaoC family dehydratase [Pseudoxanthomonas sacheonensis]|uniref:Acyl dehydratase n=1 Tax=Pseudoxanthomonas sacheonensis TaxID=443615 RepID=A0ABU1RP44_9GAMM|nr:MaoC family dehydratase [Pseudoxanthomonas sacheonensis]MDR6840543.1 acyl dehydratase [Pseudoxanthomonas sacheonensis]
MRIIENLDALPAWIGQEVACSDWLSVDQARIQRFADATGDQQWIHTDPARAQLESPYKTTIAHGYLTLSLLPQLLESCLRIDGVGMSVNYGLDRVRFPAPLPAGQRVRARLILERLQSVAGGLQAHWDATIELEQSDKPVCVAQMLVRYYPSTTP